MDEQYIKEHTKDWVLEEDEGVAQIWSCFDMVEWDRVYVLKVGDEVKEVIKDYTVDKGYGIARLVARAINEKWGK